MKRLIPVLLAMVLALTMGFGVVYAEDTYPPSDEGVVPVLVEDYKPGQDLAGLMGELCYAEQINWEGKSFPYTQTLVNINSETAEDCDCQPVITITPNAEKTKFSWTSDVPILKVIVKAGKDGLIYTYEYVYSAPVYGDAGLYGPEDKEISNTAFGWTCDNGGGQEVPIPGLNTWGTLAGMLLIGATGILVYRRRLLTA